MSFFVGLIPDNFDIIIHAEEVVVFFLNPSTDRLLNMFNKFLFFLLLLFFFSIFLLLFLYESFLNGFEHSNFEIVCNFMPIQKIFLVWWALFLREFGQAKTTAIFFKTNQIGLLGTCCPFLSPNYWIVCWHHVFYLYWEIAGITTRVSIEFLNLHLWLVIFEIVYPILEIWKYFPIKNRIVVEHSSRGVSSGCDDELDALCLQKTCKNLRIVEELFVKDSFQTISWKFLQILSIAEIPFDFGTWSTDQILHFLDQILGSQRLDIGIWFLDKLHEGNIIFNGLKNKVDGFLHWHLWRINNTPAVVAQSLDSGFVQWSYFIGIFHLLCNLIQILVFIWLTKQL